MRGAEPNAGHLAVAALQTRRAASSASITQNVDGLHQAAGSPRWSNCTAGSTASSACRASLDRARRDIDARLREANPEFGAHGHRDEP